MFTFNVYSHVYDCIQSSDHFSNMSSVYKLMSTEGNTYLYQVQDIVEGNTSN